jgi:acyl carrier protein
MTAEDRARTLTARALEIQGEIDPGASVATLAAWDSLGHTRLVFELEAALGRTLSSEEIVSIDSVRAVAKILESAA